jgi:hypothetical protein
MNMVENIRVSKKQGVSLSSFATVSFSETLHHGDFLFFMHLKLVLLLALIHQSFSNCLRILSKLNYVLS